MSSEAEEQEIQRQEDGCGCSTVAVENPLSRNTYFGVKHCPLHQFAPEMLDTLKEIATELEHDMHWTGTELGERILAVIAEAEEEKP